MTQKRNLIIEALTDKPMTWNELKKATKLSKSSLQRYLNRLISENIVQGRVHIRDNKQITVYTIADTMEVHRPIETVIVRDIKRLKGRKMKLIPLNHKK